MRPCPSWDVRSDLTPPRLALFPSPGIVECCPRAPFAGNVGPASVTLDEPQKRRAADAPEVIALVTTHIDLVSVVAGSMKRVTPRADFDDLVSAGREGLLAAARVFDASHGVPFKAFASFRVRGAMIDYLRTSQKVSRAGMTQIRAFERAQAQSIAYAEEDAARPSAATAEEADKLLSDRLAANATAMALAMLASSGGDTLDHVASRDDEEQNVERRVLISRVESILGTRPEAEREMIRLHYFEDLSLEEVGARLGLHKSWVSRVMARTVEQLGVALRDTVDP